MNRRVVLILISVCLAAYAWGARVYIGTPAATMTEPFCGG